MSVVLTFQIARECGDERDPGKLYGCRGVSTTGGVSIYDAVLLDPPIHLPPNLDKWRGVQVVPEWAGLPQSDDMVVLWDMISRRQYSIASYMEEAGLGGFSRNIPASLDFEQFAGKRIFLALVHWEAVPIWAWDVPKDERPDDYPALPMLVYDLCHVMRRIGRGAALSEGEVALRFNDCTFHHWPLCRHQINSKRWTGGWNLEKKEYLGPSRVRMASETTFDPYWPIGWHGDRRDLEWLLTTFPKPVRYEPGIFGIVELTHLEVRNKVPDGCNAAEGSLPVVTLDY